MVVLLLSLFIESQYSRLIFYQTTVCYSNKPVTTDATTPWIQNVHLQTQEAKASAISLLPGASVEVWEQIRLGVHKHNAKGPLSHRVSLQPATRPRVGACRGRWCARGARNTGCLATGAHSKKWNKTFGNATPKRPRSKAETTLCLFPKGKKTPTFVAFHRPTAEAQGTTALSGGA